MSKCFPENEQHNNLTNYKWKFLFTTYIPEPTIFRILLNIHTILAEVANNCLLIFISLIISDDEYFLHNHYYHVLFNDEASSPNLMLLLFCYWVYMSWKWPFNVWCTIFFQLVRISCMWGLILAQHRTILVWHYLIYSSLRFLLY